MVKAYIDNGNREHEERQRNCHIKKTRLPDGTEPDCIKNRVVINEIWPWNMGQSAQGRLSGRRLPERTLERMTKERPEQHPLPPAADWNHLANCVQTLSDGSKRLVLDTYIETYNFCPGDNTMFFSTKEPFSTWEPPDAPRVERRRAVAVPRRHGSTQDLTDTRSGWG